MARNTLPGGMNLLALAGSLPRESAPDAAGAEKKAIPLLQRRSTPPHTAVSEAPSETIANIPRPSMGSAETRKQKVNARISAALLDEVRDCVVALSGPPHGLTMDQFAEEAYRRELERLRRTLGSGESFPRRPYNPKPGRRIT